MSAAASSRTPRRSRLDVDALRVHLAPVLVGADASVREAFEMLLGLLGKVGAENARLEMEVMRLLRKHVGRTSERVSPEQLTLLMGLFETGDADPAAATDQEATLDPAAASLPDGGRKPRRKGHGRTAIPPHLPRIAIEHRVPDEQRACPCCGGERTCIGHERSEVLEYEPSRLVVEEHLREKLACTHCEQSVATAEAPAKAIEKGRPGPALLAHVATSKYADHLPLTRIAKIYEREGVHLPVSTLADWVAAVDRAVAPLADRIRELVINAHLVQADDTGLKVLDDKAPGGSKRGHLWCYVGDAELAAFVYTPDWRKEGPQGFLAARRGWLQADAYKGYDGLFTGEGATAIEVGCWAHARRRFVELLEAGDTRVAPVLLSVQRLYAVERGADADGVGVDERRARRDRESRPILDEIGAWMVATYNREPPKSGLAQACGYLVNQWHALGRFLEDGALPLDNTRVERALRPVAIGRKNYLFAGSDAGAERAATIYTLFGTCALVGVDPYAYLADVLRKLEIERFPAARIDELLPPSWARTAPPTARVPPRR